MYYLDEIMDRTFEGWSRMLGANEYSFWASSEIEMKPTYATPDTSDSPETDTATNTPAETPTWEPADTNDWNTCKEDTCDSNPMSDTLHHIAATARQVVEEINPFTDRESEDD
jgi:hypothetical protein